MSPEGEPNPRPAPVEPLPHAETHPPTSSERIMALLEVVICSGYPTQLALGATIAALGFEPMRDGQLVLGYVVLVSLVDCVLLIGLIAMFVSVHGERLRDLLLGDRPFAAEARVGVSLALVALVLGVAVIYSIQELAPWLHNIDQNPMRALLRTPRDIVLFGVVAVLVAAVREEIQRAFLLNRFERWLGGAGVGMIVTSLSFGAGHLVQGADAAITTGILGAFWAVVYLRRRSVVSPAVSHSGFNLMQLVLAIGQ
jgi:membrane protease YdiL (CAAX protease family)